MPALDLVAHVHRLTRIRDAALYDLLSDGLSHWGPHEENTALLLEAQSYALELSWVDRITDPDDPAVKRERAQAKRAGIKPPPHPLIPPIAHRPDSVAEQRLREYLDAVARYQTGPPPDVRHLTSVEFDRELGLIDESA
ncbi:hypothetical protein ACQPXB_35865 [Amycolatopsis sp. CA-161197]|uniref:hypothetical protein n=1 Tax=Amycolatopsis sp. CA-161197 TaxID=3239922 RepID=UPI003D8A934F